MCTGVYLNVPVVTCVYLSVFLCICVYVLAYLAASRGVMTPVTCLTPVAGVSLCVGGADALSTLRVTVSFCVITGACWEDNRLQPIRVKTDSQSVTRYLHYFITCAAVGMETIVTMATVVTLMSSHALCTLAPPLGIT